MTLIFMQIIGNVCSVSSFKKWYHPLTHYTRWARILVLCLMSRVLSDHLKQDQRYLIRNHFVKNKTRQKQKA